MQDIGYLCQDNIGIFLKLYLLLYADYTVILSETPEGLQNALNTFEIYCNMWKLTVNLNKTKVVVFSKRKSNKHNFYMYNKQIEIQDFNTYLGNFV